MVIQCREAHLITITPEEVFGAEVLVRILGTFLERGHVFPMFPMLVPLIISVRAGDDHANRDKTGRLEKSTTD